jgi:sulfur carrier protein
MIEITLNAEIIQIKPDTTLAEFLKEQDLSGSLGVAIDMEFIPKDKYEQIVLQQGNSIDVLAPVCGG